MLKNNRKTNFETLRGILPLAGHEEIVDRYGAAAAEFIKGYKGVEGENGEVIVKGLKHIARSAVHEDYRYANLKQQAGFSAEVQYVSKENARRIIEGRMDRIARSNDAGLGNHQQIDVLAVDTDGNPLMTNGQPLWGAQMKFCGQYETEEQIINSSEQLARKMAGKAWDRYRSNKVLVPSEQAEHIKRFASKEADKLYRQADKFRQQGDTAKAQLLEEQARNFKQVSEDVTDSGISSKEAMFLREHAELGTAKHVLLTSHRAGLEKAKAGAVIAGTLAVAANVVQLVRKEQEVNEALKDVAVKTVAGASTSYVVTASGTAVKAFMQTSSNRVISELSRTNLPTILANAGVQIGKSLYRYANGDIDEAQLAEELGEKGVGMLAAGWGAAAGTLLLPGIGTAVGGMLGYTVSSILYKSAMETFAEENLSLERREKIAVIADAALGAMERQRLELNDLIDRFFSHRKQVFDAGFVLLELSTERNDLELFTRGLNGISVEMGFSLQFKHFDEFDAFMKDPDSVLEF